MHDWTLVSVLVDWANGMATINLRNALSSDVEIMVHGLSMLKIPRNEQWGPSVSVNEVTGPCKTRSGIERLTIEMQSGDIIEIEGRSIELPLTDE